jgi:hypothetical protein
LSHQLDELGFMTDPDFHDGHLDGIHRSGSTVELALRHISGNEFRMVLIGAEALRADEFLLGNIVLNIRLTSGTRLPANDLSLLYPAPHPSVDLRFHERHSRFLEGIVTRIERRDVIFFQLSSSYGCDLSAICKDVEVRQAAKK